MIFPIHLSILTKKCMTLGHLNRYDSNIFEKIVPHFVNGRKIDTQRYAKFRVDTCNATDVTQEKPRGVGSTLPPSGGRRLQSRFVLFLGSIRN